MASGGASLGSRRAPPAVCLLVARPRRRSCNARAVASSAHDGACDRRLGGCDQGARTSAGCGAAARRTRWGRNCRRVEQSCRRKRSAARAGAPREDVANRSSTCRCRTVMHCGRVVSLRRRAAAAAAATNTSCAVRGRTLRAAVRAARRVRARGPAARPRIGTPRGASSSGATPLRRPPRRQRVTARSSPARGGRRVAALCS